MCDPADMADIADLIVLPATAPAAVPSNVLDAVIDEVIQSTRVKRMRSQSLNSLSAVNDDDADGDVKSAVKKPRGRPKAATAVFKTSKAGKHRGKKAKSSKTDATASCVATAADPTTSASPAPAQTEDDDHSSAVTGIDYEQIGKILSERLGVMLLAKMQPLSVTITAMQKEIQSLKQTVVKLSTQVSELSTSLSTSLAAVAGHCENTTPADSQPGAPATSVPSQRNGKSYAAATVPGAGQSTVNQSSRLNAAPNARQRRDPQQEAKHEAVTAMYVDMKRKQQRANNIVISGLPATDNDAVRVTELLRSEYEWDVTDWPGVSVNKCRRLGKPQANKVQPLLVTLADRHQAEYYVNNAKILRSSEDPQVKLNVFINADLTSSESKAAYELRVQRRQREEREQARRDRLDESASGRSGRVFYRSHNGAAATAAASTAAAAPSLNQSDQSSSAAASRNDSAPSTSSSIGCNLQAPSFSPSAASSLSAPSSTTTSGGCQPLQQPPAGRPVNAPQ